ncbi:hypothetical protein ACA910_019198 [Epithemia clementina (nom. ined.)]
MDGTLHLRYISTDTEDYAGDDEEDDGDRNSKPKSTPSFLVDSSCDETMAEEESLVIQTFGAKAPENATTSSGEILDVTNSVNHLLDTTLDTVETAGDKTNSSSSVNPMSMDGTLHLRYISTDTEDYAGDDEEDDRDCNIKPTNTPSSLVDSSYDETMAEEESSVIQTFGAEAPENAITSSGEILDVWGVQEARETDDNGPPIIEIDNAPIGVGGIWKAVAANALASLSNKPQLIRNQATTFLEFISWPLYPFSSSYHPLPSTHTPASN